MLTWHSSSDDFRLASNTEIIALYKTAEAITPDSSRVRRLAETVLGKRIGDDGLREHRNLCFAWENFNSPFLRIPEPIRFVEFQQQPLSSSGFLIMEYLQETSLDSIKDEVDDDIIGRVAQAIRFLHDQAVPTSSANAIGSFTDDHTDGFPWGQNGARSFPNLHALESALNTRLAVHPCPSSWTIGLAGRRLAFCHMDLAPRNILLLKDDTIAILDWMTLAVYPVVFEYANLAFLTRTARPQEQRILQAVHQLFSGLESEKEIRMLNEVHAISIQYFFNDTY